jgi:hypothetical protein
MDFTSINDDVVFVRHAIDIDDTKCEVFESHVHLTPFTPKAQLPEQPFCGLGVGSWCVGVGVFQN